MCPESILCYCRDLKSNIMLSRSIVFVWISTHIAQCPVTASAINLHDLCMMLWRPSSTFLGRAHALLGASTLMFNSGLPVHLCHVAVLYTFVLRLYAALHFDAASS